MTIPFLINFSPTQLRGEPCQSIDDMIVISIQQRTESTDINYNIGSLDDINLPISIQNVTNNANLEISITENKNVFLINNQKFSVYNFTLGPGEINTVIITLNKEVLDSVSENFQDTLQITAKNITNGAIVTKNLATNTLTVSYLDNTFLIST